MRISARNHIKGATVVDVKRARPVSMSVSIRQTVLTITSSEAPTRRSDEIWASRPRAHVNQSSCEGFPTL